MGKERVTHDLVDGLPVSRDHALLVQVNEVALDKLGVVGSALRMCLLQQVAIPLFEGVAEGLQLLQLLLSEELFDDLAQQVHISVFVLKLVVLTCQLL